MRSITFLGVTIHIHNIKYMENWEELIVCDIANAKFGNFNVKSNGDWSIIISRT